MSTSTQRIELQNQLAMAEVHLSEVVMNYSRVTACRHIAYLQDSTIQCVIDYWTSMLSKAGHDVRALQTRLRELRSAEY